MTQELNEQLFVFDETLSLSLAISNWAKTTVQSDIHKEIAKTIEEKKRRFDAWNQMGICMDEIAWIEMNVKLKWILSFACLSNRFVLRLFDKNWDEGEIFPPF